MANIIVPQRRVWTRQPQYAIPMVSPGGIYHPPVLPVAKIIDARGVAGEFTGAADCRYPVTNTINGANSLTMFAAFYVGDLSGEHRGIIGTRSTTSATSYIQLVQRADSTFGAQVYPNASGTETYLNAGIVSVGYHTLVLTIGADCRMYVDAKSVGTFARSNGNNFDSHSLCYVGNYYDNTINRRFVGKIYSAGFLLNTVFSPEQARLYHENAYSIFARRARRTIIETSTGNTYIISSTGSIIFSGSSTQLYNKVFATTGTLNLLGTNNLVFSNGATTYVIIPSGSIEINGTGQYNKENLLIPQGSISYSGSSPQRRTNTLLPTGELTFSGNSNFGKVKVVSITGTILFNGTAQIYMPGMEVDTTSILLTGVGK